MKNGILIITLLLNFAAISQIDTVSVQKEILLNNKNKDKNSYVISEKDVIKVWLKGVEKPIKGALSYLNDSTLLLNDAPTAIAEIEQIKVTRESRNTPGIIFIILGGLVSSVSLQIAAESKDKPGAGQTFINDFGNMGLFVGVLTGTAGILALTIGPKKYKLDEWEFQFKPIR